MTHLVTAQMLPVKFNKSMMAGKEADGETYMLMTYVRIPPKLGAGYRSDAEPQNVEQLLVRFLMRADQVLARIGQMFRVRTWYLLLPLLLLLLPLLPSRTRAWRTAGR